MSAASVKNLRFAYAGGPDMHFDFEVAHGARLAIMGASGSGKSTLLHLLSGLETPQSGIIRFDHVDLTYTEPAARPVSIVFQDNNLFGHLTVAQNTGLGLGSRLHLNPSQAAAVETALSKVALSGMGKRLPRELSGGERQRVALARCLLRNRKVLLLDEPFAALGPAMRIDMLDLVKDLQREKNLTVIMVTHNRDDAAYFATDVGLVENGKLSGTMPVAALHDPVSGSALSAYLGRNQNPS